MSRSGSDPDRLFDGESDSESLNWAQVQRFIEAPRLRPWLVILPWAGVVLLSVAALFVMPKKYRSSTLILVESERVPDSFVAKVATGDRTRIDAIRPEILSRTRLERVLDETKPYPESDSKARAVEAILGSTAVNASGNDGFTISFVHKDPHKAQEVAGRLASLFIEETTKAREAQVEGAVDFLVKQVASARAELEKKDEALRVYKQGNMGRLPEQLQTNLATMGMLQRELQTIEESLVFARERQQALVRGSARAGMATTGGSESSASSDLLEARRQLAGLSGRYTDEHPDVQRLRSRIALLEARMADQPSGPARAPVDPAAREDIEKANAEIARLEGKRSDLEGRIGVMRGNVEYTPRTEQELTTLMRDYEKLSENYQALLSKQFDAEMAGRLEQRWKGDRFRILDPPNLPDKPYSPKPLMLIGMGALAGLGLGLAAAIGAEFFDPTVKATLDLQTIQSYPVLACIPHLPGLAEPPAR